jgi:hypothetical protein
MFSAGMSEALDLSMFVCPVSCILTHCACQRHTSHLISRFISKLLLQCYRFQIGSQVIFAADKAIVKNVPKTIKSGRSCVSVELIYPL